MTHISTARLAAAFAALMLATPISAESAKDHAHSHDHAHDHAHNHRAEAEKSVYDGYFEDSQVHPRPLSDWEGVWQSVYPYLLDGTLDPVFAHKAESGEKTAAEYREYYDTGYKTDTNGITIHKDVVSFTSPTGVLIARYEPDGHEILTYAKGNRGVRFIFKKASGDDAAPDFIQFSDHIIAPLKSDHYHLYWGDDREALLSEVTHWPTYYPADLTGEQIVKEMTEH